MRALAGASQTKVVAACCSVLQCVVVFAVFCSVLYTQTKDKGDESISRSVTDEGSCIVLQCAAVRCRVLQFAAVCCSVLQGVAGCCRVLRCVAV